MSEILNETKKLLAGLNEFGDDINFTKEEQSILLKFKMKDISIAQEEIDIREYYNETIHENYTARMKVEQDHYLFLEYALKHKISEIQYFHKGEGIWSRKFIVFSGDCINCINLLIREKKNILNVFMRSSDVLRLLPMDILSCMKLLYKVIERHGELSKELDEVNFFITSAHYYERDNSLVRQVLSE